MFFWKGKQHKGIIALLNSFDIYFQRCEWKWFLITNKPKFSRIYSFGVHYVFCKGQWPQKIGDCACPHCMFLFANNFSNGLFKMLFISFLIFLAICPRFAFTCFKNIIAHYFWNMKQDLSSTLFFVLILHDILVYYNTKFNTWLLTP